MITVKLIHIAGKESLPVHVATLQSNARREKALFDAWLGTQNDGGSWVTDGGCNDIAITPVPGMHPRYRSTLVGDYAYVAEAAGGESYWRLRDDGWRKIEFMPPHSPVRLAATIGRW